MAEYLQSSFLDRINALTNAGLTADGLNSDGTVSTTGTDEKHVQQWLIDGVKEVISYMPLSEKLHCAIESAAFNCQTHETDSDKSGFSTDNEILGVIRATGTDFATVYQCRAISFMQRHETSDSNSVLYATPTDPVYYLEPQTNADPIIKVLPDGGFNVGNTDGDASGTGTSSAICKVQYVNYHTVSTDADVETWGDEDTLYPYALRFFPDTWEPIVVLYAAIRAAEYLFAKEEDDELYIPMINSLRADYVSALQAKGAKLPSASKTPVPKTKMQDLMKQIGLTDS